MINLFKNWWRSYQFSSALKGKKFKLAEKIFQEIQKSDANLSILESLYLENQRLISSLDIYKKETLGWEHLSLALSNYTHKNQAYH